VLAAVFASYLLFSLSSALVLARRDKGFSLLTAYHLTLNHMVLLFVAAAAFVAGGPLGRPEIIEVLSFVPDRGLDGGFPLRLAQGYVAVFILATALSVASALLLRLLGLRRMVASEA
jgi:hypothetical protein